MAGAGGAIPAVVFVPPAGRTPAERWMAAARTAAAADLVERLAAAGCAAVYVAAADPADGEGLASLGATLLPTEAEPFHFGRALASVIEARGLDALAYFGAASAPLATAERLSDWLRRGRELPRNAALVNNLHSTDFAIVRDARQILPLADRLPTDNPLGWVLREQGGAVVEALPPAAATRADFDTPADLAMLAGHPDLGPNLRRALEPLPESLGRRAAALGELLRTPAASLALIGRVSEAAWGEAVRRSQTWIRVYAEERGMRASGRLARGEVRSLIGELVGRDGAPAFVERLATMVQGAIWDTRVWMALRGPWPSAADRMAADLGRVEDVKDVALRGLTQAVVEARIPILTGGQGVVAGCLMALVETLLP